MPCASIRSASVRIADEEVSAGVTRYLSLVADDLRRDERQVTVAARGTGTRDLYLSYIAEVPVWKSTYRLLMPSDSRPTPLLQGWAVIDNTVGEDWRNVEMALVAGAPQSFVQRLSQPRYRQRPTLEISDESSLRPVVHEPGVATASTTNRSGASTFSVGNLRESITVMGSTPTIETSMSSTPSSTPHVPYVRSAPDSRTVEEQMALSLPQATAQPIGELFEYRIAGPVTVRKNESALVPILRSAVTAERVSLWSDALGTSRPLRAVWLTNTTGLTLDGGTVSIVDGGAFGGEGTVETLVPGARRLVSFARDLSMAVVATADADRRTLVAIASADGFLVERRETCARRTYTLRNDDRATRTLVVEHPIRRGWTLAGGLVPAESTASAHRFQVAVDPNASKTLVVQEVYPSEFRYEASQLTVPQIAAYATRDGLGAAAAAALRELVDLQQLVGRAEADKTRAEEEGEAIAADQERVRKNMGALKGSSEERQLLQRYVRQLSEHENRLQLLAQEGSAANAREVAARATFDQAVRAFAVDLATPGAACR